MTYRISADAYMTYEMNCDGPMTCGINAHAYMTCEIIGACWLDERVIFHLFHSCHFPIGDAYMTIEMRALTFSLLVPRICPRRLSGPVVRKSPTCKKEGLLYC